MFWEILDFGLRLYYQQFYGLGNENLKSTLHEIKQAMGSFFKLNMSDVM